MGSSSIVKVVADGNQRPAVKVGQSHHSGWIVWKDDKWNTLQSLPANRGFQRPNGDVLFNAPWGIWTLDDLAAPRHLRKFAPSGLHTPSQVGTLLFDRLIGAGMNPDKTTATLYEIRLPSIAEKEAGGEKQLNEILE
jgi:hypothetical protein